MIIGVAISEMLRWTVLNSIYELKGKDCYMLGHSPRLFEWTSAQRS